VPKKFIFRLESLLRYRQHLERMAQQKVAQAYLSVSECEYRINSIADALSETLKDLEERMLAGIEAQQVQLYSSYVVSLESALESERNRLQGLKRALKEAQDKLAKKAVEKKVLENLKDRKKSEYYDEVTRLFQKETEELNIIRNARDSIR